jgi:butyrate kinase
MQTGPETAYGRVVIADLGNGASMTAVRHGKNVDTTTGFTPAGAWRGPRRSHGRSTDDCAFGVAHRDNSDREEGSAKGRAGA